MKGTILVVDDDRVVREPLCRALGTMGFEALQAIDGREALQILKERAHSIGLVITDIRMPKMGGFELWEKAKDLCPRWLVMTGRRNEDAGKFEEAGVTVLDKSFTLAEFRAAIEAVLEK